MKHTKGKWVKGYGNGLTGPTSSRGPNPTVDDERGYIPISKGKETIAIVIMQCSEDAEELEANAKLISEAPEINEQHSKMLEALKECNQRFAKQLPIPNHLQNTILYLLKELE